MAMLLNDVIFRPSSGRRQMGVVGLVSVTAVLSVLNLALAEGLCGPNGICADAQRAYVAVIQGDACRSFYATGKCSALCLRSLRAMVAKHTWSRCALRCQWDRAFMEASYSWLRLCTSRPAADAKQPEVINVISRRGHKVSDSETDKIREEDLSFDYEQHIDHDVRFRNEDENHFVHDFQSQRPESGAAGSNRKRIVQFSAARFMSSVLPFKILFGSSSMGLRFLLLFVCIAVVFTAVIIAVPPRTGPFKRLSLKLRFLMGNRKRQGLLDGSVSETRLRKDFETLQRGARRHLKGMHSALD